MNYYQINTLYIKQELLKGAVPSRLNFSSVNKLSLTGKCSDERNCVTGLQLVPNIPALLDI